jgi:hypothetical protein
LDDIDNDLDGEPLASALDAELAEMDQELLGMKTSLASSNNEDDDDEENQEEKVEDLTRIMASLQAIRGMQFISLKVMMLILLDTGATMPEQERKIFAAKSVNELMKSL